MSHCVHRALQGTLYSCVIDTESLSGGQFKILNDHISFLMRETKSLTVGWRIRDTYHKLESPAGYGSQQQ